MLTLNLTLNGAPLTDFDTPIPFAIGDSIALSAGASCSPTGNLNFSWKLGPGHFVARENELDGFSIELYPDEVGALSLEIAIDEGAGPPLRQTIPITGVGFASLDIFEGLTGSVDEMVIGGGSLWLATQGGAFTQGIGDLATVPYTKVNDLNVTSDVTIPTNITDVTFDSNNNVSFLTGDGTAAFFFDGLDIKTFAPDTTSFGTMVDVQPITGGVRVLTTIQSATSTDYTLFPLEWTQNRAVVTTVHGADLLAGGERLFRKKVDVDESDLKEIFGPGSDADDGIVTFFTDASGALWIGSDAGLADTGIAVIDNFDDATVDTHLLGERIRSIGQDAAGDMWVATATGVWRFKTDWNRWIQLGAKHGLTNIDTLSLIVDEGGGRNQILVGAADNLYRLQRP